MNKCFLSMRNTGVKIVNSLMIEVDTYGLLKKFKTAPAPGR